MIPTRSSWEGHSGSSACKIALMMSVKQNVSNIHSHYFKRTFFACPLTLWLDVVTIDPLQELVARELFESEVAVARALEIVNGVVRSNRHHLLQAPKSRPCLLAMAVGPFPRHPASRNDQPRPAASTRPCVWTWDEMAWGRRVWRLQPHGEALDADPRG